MRWLGSEDAGLYDGPAARRPRRLRDQRDPRLLAVPQRRHAPPGGGGRGRGLGEPAGRRLRRLRRGLRGLRRRRQGPDDARPEGAVRTAPARHLDAAPPPGRRLPRHRRRRPIPRHRPPARARQARRGLPRHPGGPGAHGLPPVAGAGCARGRDRARSGLRPRRRRAPHGPGHLLHGRRLGRLHDPRRVPPGRRSALHPRHRPPEHLGLPVHRRGLRIGARPPAARHARQYPGHARRDRRRPGGRRGAGRPPGRGALRVPGPEEPLRPGLQARRPHWPAGGRIGGRLRRRHRRGGLPRHGPGSGPLHLLPGLPELRQLRHRQPGGGSRPRARRLGRGPHGHGLEFLRLRLAVHRARPLRRVRLPAHRPPRRRPRPRRLQTARGHHRGQPAPGRPVGRAPLPRALPAGPALGLGDQCPGRRPGRRPGDRRLAHIRPGQFRGQRADPASAGPRGRGLPLRPQNVRLGRHCPGGLAGEHPPVAAPPGVADCD